MIGLGSNRLTVCRSGGMSVTQAGRGDMEWLGVRYPSWASPYSAQATAALKAQFPTQWPTIRDYGVAHPEIVPYVNQYPVGWGNIIANYQLCEYVRSTGTQYFRIPFNYGGGIKKIVCDYYPDAANVIFSEWKSTSYGGGISYEHNTDTQVRAWIGNSTSDWVYLTTSKIRQTAMYKDSKWTINGVLKAEKAQGDIDGISPYVHICARGLNGNLHAAQKCTIYGFEMQSQQYGIALYPCYNKTSNVIGIFDVVNNEFHENAGSGTFLKGSDIYYPGQSPS